MRGRSGIVLVGGTFDPFHIDHIRIGLYVRELWRYHKVFFVPAYTVPLRAARPVASAEARIAMLRATLAAYPQCTVVDTEIRRGTASYFSETLLSIRERYKVQSRIGVVIGEDLIDEFTRWRGIGRIIPLITLVVVRRAPRRELDISAIQRLGARIRVCTNPPSPVSSSEVRRRVACGEPFRHLVPEAVFRYITEHNLYV